MRRYGCARLFGFLVGFQGKLPIFRIELKHRYKIDEHEMHEVAPCFARFDL
jgi:hypothetical protein